MHLVVFGSSVSSSWGNGHATFWRALIQALARRGHRVTFFEKDTPPHSEYRDITEFAGGALVLYDSWESVRRKAAQALGAADAAIVTSYCPDGAQASQEALSSQARVRCFFDLDTGLTLERVRAGEKVDYLPANGLADFDLVLSNTGGRALAQLKGLLGARHVAPLYGCVDPDFHRRVTAEERFRADLSCMAAYAPDRQRAIEDFLVEPSRRRTDLRFLLAGPEYPAGFPRTQNLSIAPRVSPKEHAAFYSSSRLTLSLTRPSMAEMGYCPPEQLFEAAACGVPILSDEWEGLDYFFEPSREILVARTTGHVMDALAMSDEQLGRIARAGRERVLAAHTGERRALELESILEAAVSLPAEEAGAARE